MPRFIVSVLLVLLAVRCGLAQDSITAPAAPGPTPTNPLDQFISAAASVAALLSSIEAQQASSRPSTTTSSISSPASTFSSSTSTSASVPASTSSAAAAATGPTNGGLDPHARTIVIAVSVVGGFLLLALLALGLWLCLRRRRNRRRAIPVSTHDDTDDWRLGTNRHHGYAPAAAAQPEMAYRPRDSVKAPAVGVVPVGFPGEPNPFAHPAHRSSQASYGSGLSANDLTTHVNPFAPVPPPRRKPVPISKGGPTPQSRNDQAPPAAGSGVLPAVAGSAYRTRGSHESNQQRFSDSFNGPAVSDFAGRYTAAASSTANSYPIGSPYLTDSALAAGAGALPAAAALLRAHGSHESNQQRFSDPFKGPVAFDPPGRYPARPYPTGSPLAAGAGGAALAAAYRHHENDHDHVPTLADRGDFAGAGGRYPSSVRNIPDASPLTSNPSNPGLYTAVAPTTRHSHSQSPLRSRNTSTTSDPAQSPALSGLDFGLPPTPPSARGSPHRRTVPVQLSDSPGAPLVSRPTSTDHEDKYPRPSPAQRRSLQDRDMQYGGMRPAHVPQLPERSPKRTSFGLPDTGGRSPALGGRPRAGTTSPGGSRNPLRDPAPADAHRRGSSASSDAHLPSPAPWEDNAIRRNSSSGSLAAGRRPFAGPRRARWSDVPDEYDAGEYRVAPDSGSPVATSAPSLAQVYSDYGGHVRPLDGLGGTPGGFDPRYGQWGGGLRTAAFGNGYGVGEAL